MSRITSRSRSSAERRSATRVSCLDLTASVASSSSSRRRASAAAPARSRSASSFRRRRSRSLRASASSDRSDLMRRMVRSPSRCIARGSGRDARIAARCSRGSRRDPPGIPSPDVPELSSLAFRPAAFRDRFFSNASRPRSASSPSRSSRATLARRSFSSSAISISISRRSASARARRISACVAYSDAARTAFASRVLLNAFTASTRRSACRFEMPIFRLRTASAASAFCRSPSARNARTRDVSIKAFGRASRARTTSLKILASASRRVESRELNAPTPRWDCATDKLGFVGKDALRASAETPALLLCSTSRTMASSTLLSCTSRRVATPRSSRTMEVTARASRGTPSVCRDG